jgi:hypothetical protein
MVTNCELWQKNRFLREVAAETEYKEYICRFEPQLLSLSLYIKKSTTSFSCIPPLSLSLSQTELDRHTISIINNKMIHARHSMKLLFYEITLL